MNLREYRKACLKNRSCKAYSNSDISGQGTGCALWFGDSFLMVDRISIYEYQLQIEVFRQHISRNFFINNCLYLCYVCVSVCELHSAD